MNKITRKLREKNKEIENKIKEETKKRYMDLEKYYNAKNYKLENNIEKLEQNVEP